MNLNESSRKSAGSFPSRVLGGSLRLEEGGLTLGPAQLLKRKDGSLELDGEEQRLLTLLSVAQGQPVSASVLETLRRASKHAGAGNEALAAIHVALIKLPQLAHPSDAARRVGIADGLLAIGVRPRDIFAALEFDQAELDRLEKFNPDEPRNPKGSGRVSGWWVREMEVAEADVKVAVDELPEIAPRVLPVAGRVLAIAARVASSAAAAIPMLIPLRASGTDHEGPVPGRAGLRYSWSEDEDMLNFIRESDGQTVMSASMGPDGKFRVGPKVVGRLQGDTVVLDPFALPPDWPDLDENNDGRRLCPKETPDRDGRPEDKGGKRDRDFEDYMKLFVNPGDPTLRGMGYAFFNPSTGNMIIFDDCQKRTGILFDAKGQYMQLLANENEFVRRGVVRKLLAAADRQINASEGRPIYWVFEEKQAARIVDKLFHNKNAEPKYQQIHVDWLYWPEGVQ
jgi:hypothetical protein